MTKNDLRIDILGTSFVISTDQEPEYLNRLLSKYREAVEHIQRVSGLKDPLKIAILTGFLLCEDLQKAGTETAGKKESSEAEQLTLGMIQRLEQALEVPPEESRPEQESLLEIEPAPEPVSEIEPEPAAEPDLEPMPVQKISGDFFKLKNTVKHYDWGSPEWIPALVGQKNLSRIPWAELWMGVHPSGPSRALLPDEKELPLPELIGGGEVFGKLPFLFKVIAAAKPLSIQAHPDRDQAREGFERENRQGIPLDAPNRNYRDANHKPEILCALSPFAALCGFRNAETTRELIEILTLFAGSNSVLEGGLVRLHSALGGENPCKDFLSALFALDRQTIISLGSLIKNNRPQFEKDFPQYRDEWNLCSYFSSLHPGDPGILAPLYLNIITLEPGQAIYLPAGILHAYIHGTGIELMADSDNVLRGGLTSKHMDTGELLRLLDFSPYRPEIMSAPEPAPASYTYPAPAGEFTLSALRSSGDTIPYTETGASIVMVTSGAMLSAEMTVNAGESVFIPAGEKAPLMFSGTFTAYAAAAR